MDAKVSSRRSTFTSSDVIHVSPNPGVVGITQIVPSDEAVASIRQRNMTELVEDALPKRSETSKNPSQCAEGKRKYLGDFAGIMTEFVPLWNSREVRESYGFRRAPLL